MKWCRGHLASSEIVGILLLPGVAGVAGELSVPPDNARVPDSYCLLAAALFIGHASKGETAITGP